MPKLGDEQILAGVTFRFDGHTWVPVSGPPPDRRRRRDSDERGLEQTTDPTSEASRRASD
jgi:hypothetical protein